MLVSMKDAFDKFKNPVADVYPRAGGCYENCDIIWDNKPRTLGFISQGVVYIFPVKQIARIKVKEGEEILGNTASQPLLVRILG